MSVSIMIQDIYKKYGTLGESYNFDDIDALLVANDFDDDESIANALWFADQMAWEKVYSSRSKYVPRIRSMIEPEDFAPPTGKVKLRVVAMTDEDMDNIENIRIEAKRREFDSVWETMKETVGERPIQEIDDEFDDAWDALCAAKDELTEYLDSKRNRYIAPSARNQVDPDQQDIEDEIKRCQEEYDSLEKRISEADEKYLLDKKNEAFQKWLLEV